MLWSMLIGAAVGESSACAKPTDERWPFMPKLKPGTVIPNKEDDADINRGIFSDPDTYELGTAQMKHLRRVGRPRSPSPKVSLTVRYDADIVAAVKRSEERRVGKESVSTRRSRWSSYREKKVRPMRRER